MRELARFYCPECQQICAPGATECDNCGELIEAYFIDEIEERP